MSNPKRAMKNNTYWLLAAQLWTNARTRNCHFPNREPIMLLRKQPPSHHSLQNWVTFTPSNGNSHRLFEFRHRSVTDSLISHRPSSSTADVLDQGRHAVWSDRSGCLDPYTKQLETPKSNYIDYFVPLRYNWVKNLSWICFFSLVPLSNEEWKQKPYPTHHIFR